MCKLSTCNRNVFSFSSAKLVQRQQRYPLGKKKTNRKTFMNIALDSCHANCCQIRTLMQRIIQAQLAGRAPAHIGKTGHQGFNFVSIVVP